LPRPPTERARLKWSIPSTQTLSGNRLFPLAQKKPQVLKHGENASESPLVGPLPARPRWIVCPGASSAQASTGLRKGTCVDPAAAGMGIGNHAPMAETPNCHRRGIGRRTPKGDCAYGVFVQVCVRGVRNLGRRSRLRYPAHSDFRFGNWGFGQFRPCIPPDRQIRFNLHDRSFRNFQNSCYSRHDRYKVSTSQDREDR
jgi:hypothetical protein